MLPRSLGGVGAQSPLEVSRRTDHDAVLGIRSQEGTPTTGRYLMETTPQADSRADDPHVGTRGSRV